MRGFKRSRRILPGEDLDLVEDFGERVKNARRRLGLTQEDLARQLNEKLTVIRKIEAGEFKPPIELARKLERFLKIRLLEPIDETELGMPGGYSTGSKTAGGGISLGDLLKKRGKE